MVATFLRLLLVLPVLGCGRIGYDAINTEPGGAGTGVGSGVGRPLDGSAAARDAAVTDATERDSGLTDAMRPDAFGSWPTNPSAEACNGKDDDCDGNVDEGDPSLLCLGQNATSVCSNGQCAVVACKDTFADCDGDPHNGCETWLGSLGDCGACGSVCALPEASASCVAGNCRIEACDLRRADCDGNSENGCETTLATLSDCAGCGVSCRINHASASCASGLCEIESCDSGFQDCDGDPATGCEASLTTLADCGACGNACSLPGANPTCRTGSCRIGSCDTGLGDCNGNAADGCETRLDSLTHCGGCGLACSSLPQASTQCASGTCAIAACDTGWGDCDGDPATGCETTLTTLTDCGACGTSCALDHATGNCATGACLVSSCDAGWGDCDGDPATGCESDLRTLADCGG